MKRFYGFLIKEFYHIFRDTRTMLILFGMPVMQVLLFGFVITNEIKDAPIAVLDYSNDRVTRDITQKITSSGFFRLTNVISDPSEIEAVFRKGHVKEVIIFEHNFAQKLERDKTAAIQLIADASDANTASLIVSYTSGIIQDYVRRELQDSTLPMQIQTETRMMYNEDLKGAYMFIPGIMAMILMLISAMMTSISIAREKEMGTMEVLLVSPLKPAQIVLGKVTPYLLLSFLNAISILFLGNFVFGVPVQGSLVLLLAESMLFILLALSLGIWISTVSKGQEQAMFISMFALMLPTILLSGFIFPIENMPVVLQWLSAAMPPKYFIIIIKNIMLKGTGFGFVWQETAILAAMTLLFMGLSVKKFKIRLE